LGQDLTDGGPGSRPFQDYLTDADATMPNGDRRGQYLRVATELLIDDLTFLVAAWAPDVTGNYREGFVSGDSDQALTSMLSAIGVLGKGELASERMDVAAGTRIIDQGRVGDACFVVVEGTADVFMRDEFVTAVGPGSMVGEMALVEHRPRNASVIAHTDLVMVSFGTEEFRKLLDRSPNANGKVLALLNARLRANQARQD
jgi:hypothetical protein